MRDRAGTRRYLVLRRGRPGLGGILPDLLVQRVSKPPQTSSFSTVTSSTRSSSTASPELCFRVLWVHRDLLCAHLLPWATSCSPKTAGYQPYQLEAGAGDPVAGRDPLPAPIAYLYDQWRPPELHTVGRASWTTRPTPFAATPRLPPPA